MRKMNLRLLITVKNTPFPWYYPLPAPSSNSQNPLHASVDLTVRWGEMSPTSSSLLLENSALRQKTEEALGVCTPCYNQLLEISKLQEVLCNSSSDVTEHIIIQLPAPFIPLGMRKCWFLASHETGITAGSSGKSHPRHIVATGNFPPISEIKLTG